MDDAAIRSRLAFLREAEKLKSTLRSGHTSSGRRESTAEHSWRLCLLAMVFADAFPHLDSAKVLKLCVLHDLGEAVGGDIPATERHRFPDKAQQERQDFLRLIVPLPEAVRAEFLALWDEYENRASEEARLVKALDKLETILQHNQGKNPEDFDYAFNLGYGRDYMDVHPLITRLRALLDEETQAHAERRG